MRIMRIPFQDKLLLLAEEWAMKRGLVVERVENNLCVLEVKKRFCQPYFIIRTRRIFFGRPYEISGPYAYLAEDGLHEQIRNALKFNYEELAEK